MEGVDFHTVAVMRLRGLPRASGSVVMKKTPHPPRGLVLLSLLSALPP